MEKPVLTSRGSCHSCAYCGSRVMPGSKTIDFVCRFNPPSVHPIPMQGPQGIVIQAAVMWPGVTADDWCSRFVAQGN